MHILVSGLEGEELLHTYKYLKRISDTPNFVRRLLRPLLMMLGEERPAWIGACSVSGGITARAYWSLGADLVEFKKAYINYMATNNLDIILTPSMALPAFSHGSSKKLTPALSYTWIPNLLQWPAGVVPITTVQEGEDRYDVDQLPRNQRDMVAKNAAEEMKGSVGLPVGIQVITPYNEDELCLHVMKLLEDKLKLQMTPELAHTCVAGSAK